MFILAPQIPCRFSFHSTTWDSRVHAGDGARGQNLVHIQKIGFLRLSFLEVHYFDNHLSESIHTCPKDTLQGWLSFYDIESRSSCPGWVKRSNYYSTYPKDKIFVSKFSRSPYIVRLAFILLEIVANLSCMFVDHRICFNCTIFVHKLPMHT